MGRLAVWADFLSSERIAAQFSSFLPILLAFLRRVLAPRRKVGRLVRKTVLFGFSVLALLVAPSARAHEELFRIFEVSGALENPVNGSAGFGSGLVTFDLDLFTMRVEGSFGGLTGNVTASHIHCCQVPPTNSIVATITPSFTGFPLGVTAGSYDHTYDMSLASSYNAAFITAHGGSVSSAFQDLLDGAHAGQAYWNIHTSFRAGGEIRGFLAFVPEPSSLLLAAMGMAGFFVRRRNR